jgi:hypothetical protein
MFMVVRESVRSEQDERDMSETKLERGKSCPTATHERLRMAGMVSESKMAEIESVYLSWKVR